MLQGQIIYDPVHRVPYKQEIATRRTYAQNGIAQLARLIAHKSVQGYALKSAKKHLAALAEDPYIWTRLGKDQATAEQVEDLYKLLDHISKTSGDEIIETWLNIVEQFLVKTETKPWTAIVRVDQRITSSYLRQIRAQGKKISNPAWGPHITFIRGEQPPILRNWLANNNQTCEFEIISEPKSSIQGHWWVDISSPELIKIRTNLGLSPEPRIPLHLTIGKQQ